MPSSRMSQATRVVGGDSQRCGGQVMVLRSPGIATGIGRDLGVDRKLIRRTTNSFQFVALSLTQSIRVRVCVERVFVCVSYRVLVFGQLHGDYSR